MFKSGEKVMKSKLKNIILSVSTILMLCGCDESKPKTYLKCNNGNLWVDTITIHEKKHEVLFWSELRGNASIGGMMHSPECWCLKESEE